VTSSDPALSIF